MATEPGDDVVLLWKGDVERLRQQLAEAKAREAKNRAEIRLLEKKVHAAEYLEKAATNGD